MQDGCMHGMNILSFPFVWHDDSVASRFRNCKYPSSFFPVSCITIYPISSSSCIVRILWLGRELRMWVSEQARSQPERHNPINISILLDDLLPVILLLGLLIHYSRRCVLPPFLLLLLIPFVGGSGRGGGGGILLHSRRQLRVHAPLQR